MAGWDIALGLWAIACVVLAAATALEIRALNRLSDTFTGAGRALDATATGLDRMADVPFIGTEISGVMARLRETSESALVQTRETTATIDAVSTLIGVSIVVVAVVSRTVAFLAVRPSLRRRRRAR